MKAIVIPQPGDPSVLTLTERPDPVPAAHEVLIAVKAAGVNRPDIIQRKGHYAAPPGIVADIPGLEVAGEIIACGSEVSRWKPGDRVCALLGGGGYASKAIAQEGQCLPIPAGWTEAEAASLPETVLTVWHNVFQRGQLQAGEHLLVHGGSSGIGITAIQLAKAFGAKVSVTAGSEEKCEACRRLGAGKAINYKEQDFAQILEQEGVNVILDMIGAKYFPQNINLLQPDGRLVFINAMKGNEANFAITDLMRKRLTITGSTLRSRDNAFKASLTREVEEKVWPVLESGQFKPVIYRSLPLSDAAEAHSLMEASVHIGKIVLLT
ncbi:NAD(P)H-quinone oxidoreductase [Filimonas effusa]|uniref:NAD(P)H-quinone oxidoreductase n=1 Tax=Filimonas effusa TaxID=2508721 RepID=A0A4Q1CZQ1_9BACT|nr:NAD(P)H-quinone oxidoreductase [Filimonas effusa]RXK80890.1 NAD(P)H-quinone oxidoreductase [Filimonas effusa]